MPFQGPSVVEQLLARFRQWIVYLAGKKSLFINVLFKTITDFDVKQY